ncbi:MAG: hypothetical protein ACI9C8_001049, partial [Oceanospirillaceae bacterium]
MSNPTSHVQKQDNRFIHPWDNFQNLGNNQRTVVEKGDGI